ncbi:MAG: hypothetical protein ABIE68_05015 [bacterium]
MAEPLTKKELDKGLEGLARIFKKEFDSVDNKIDSLTEEVNRRFETEVKPLSKKIDNLTNSIDNLIKTVERWYEDSKIIAARVEKIKQVLIAKGIVTEKELNL